MACVIVPAFPRPARRQKHALHRTGVTLPCSLIVYLFPFSGIVYPGLSAIFSLPLCMAIKFHRCENIFFNWIVFPWSRTVEASEAAAWISSVFFLLIRDTTTHQWFSLTVAYLIISPRLHQTSKKTTVWQFPAHQSGPHFMLVTFQNTFYCVKGDLQRADTKYTTVKFCLSALNKSCHKCTGEDDTGLTEPCDYISVLSYHFG